MVVDEKFGDMYAAYNGDAIETMETLPTGKVHLSIYSPPFATSGGALYTYSSSERDLSNCVDYDQFFEQYTFAVKGIYRITMQGRMTCVHCMDVPTGNTGTDGLIDFPGDIIRTHVQCRSDKCNDSQRRRERGLCGHGWFDYIARYHIWKEPLAVRNRTMAKNLAHKTIVEDSSKCSVASADYLLVFRRKGANLIPIKHPYGLLSYAGERKMPSELLRYRGWKGNQIENRFSHWIWRQYASAFWDDIRIGRVLPFKAARDSEDEKHVHPLQLDVIERCLVLWSNPGETVFSPFAGVGSEVCAAIANERMGIGVELKPSYYRQMLKNLDTVVRNGGLNEEENHVLEFGGESELEGEPDPLGLFA